MAKIKKLSPVGFKEIVQSEGLKMDAYLDTANVPTIGIGTTRYPSGARVKMGDKCTIMQATEYFAHDSLWAAKAVDDLTRDDINQNQFDALFSFIYNVGPTAYRNSTLRKLVNANPVDPQIREAFAMWNRSGGKVTKGLVLRRQREADLYFKA